MNRYPTWIYVIVACTMVLGFIYTLPNFFGDSPAVQVSSIKATVKVDSDVLARVEAALKAANIADNGIYLDSNGIKVRFADTDTQLKAKDVLSESLNPERDNPSFIVALNLLSSSPNWLTDIGALPMYLGLDLRGGVHFTLEVDMKAALTKRLENINGDIRVELRDKDLRYSGIRLKGNAILLDFHDADTRAKSRKVLEDNQ
ncbi:MAG TPA: protein translocase subunit SecD, partial [Burkholderiales bacterium]|nr:protein translocase subunit SecD [Burkholderiales bacterium]